MKCAAAVPVGLFALAANAFMIPSTNSLPDVKVDDNGALHGLGLPTALNIAKSRIVDLNCPGCSWPEDTAALFDGKDKPNHLQLNFTISPDGKTLLLNTLPFFSQERAGLTPGYPTIQIANDDPADIKAHVISTHPREMHYTTHANVIDAADGSDAKLINIDFSVNDLDGEAVKGADSLNLRLLQDEKAVLSISDVVNVPEHGTATPANGAHDDADDEEAKFTIKPVNDIKPADDKGDDDRDPLVHDDEPPQPPNVPGCPAGRAPSATICRLMSFMKTRMHVVAYYMRFTKPIKHHHKAPGHPCPGKMRQHLPNMPHHHFPDAPPPPPMPPVDAEGFDPLGGHKTGPMGVKVKGGLPKFWAWRTGGPLHAAPPPINEDSPSDATPDDNDPDAMIPRPRPPMTPPPGRPMVHPPGVPAHQHPPFPSGTGPTGHRYGPFVKCLMRIGRAARHFFWGFLLPVFVGVAAGMTASVLGMLVGALCGWGWGWWRNTRVWRKMTRRGRGRCTRLGGYSAVAGEKDGLVPSPLVGPKKLKKVRFTDESKDEEEEKSLMITVEDVDADAEVEGEPLPRYSERE